MDVLRPTSLDVSHDIGECVTRHFVCYIQWHWCATSNDSYTCSYIQCTSNVVWHIVCSIQWHWCAPSNDTTNVVASCLWKGVRTCLKDVAHELSRITRPRICHVPWHVPLTRPLTGLTTLDVAHGRFELFFWMFVFNVWISILRNELFWNMYFVVWIFLCTHLSSLCVNFTWWVFVCVS